MASSECPFDVCFLWLKHIEIESRLVAAVPSPFNTIINKKVEISEFTFIVS